MLAFKHQNSLVGIHAAASCKAILTSATCCLQLHGSEPPMIEIHYIPFIVDSGFTTHRLLYSLHCLKQPGMQGMEKNIILLATTITHAGNFATDAQRVNVAFTRAKHHLVVFGCSHVLRSCSPAFRMLLAGCQMLPAGASFLSQSSAQIRGSALPDSHALPTAPSGHRLTPIPVEAFCGSLPSNGGNVEESSAPAIHAGAFVASLQPDADTPSGAAAPSKSALPDGMHCPAGFDAPLTASMCSSPERLCSKVDGVAPGTANCHKPDEAAIADSPGADEEPLQELLIDI